MKDDSVKVRRRGGGGWREGAVPEANIRNPPPTPPHFTARPLLTPSITLPPVSLHPSLLPSLWPPRYALGSHRPPFGLTTTSTTTTTTASSSSMYHFSWPYCRPEGDFTASRWRSSSREGRLQHGRQGGPA
ncbi:hypothetical protein E2C01_045079 [Portunus trituberculatus]|uniref:Uncharacterized protein n=1 Tax=Portunus trituberculatus TaxID=210409 RepID=A0A5B7G040_PORTR|nr:hypothetical protein [Portunus trituberculatus]